jgi:NADPH:quinone reductase-like Zn-dependent oxidoreductase
MVPNATSTTRKKLIMRAARYSQYGDPDVLTVEEAPTPHAQPGAIRIRTRAASVNPIDTIVRSGRVHAFLPRVFPVIPGRDAAGVVDEIGDGVTGVAIGDAVFGLGGISDTTSEHSILTAWAPIPPTWTFEQAAAAGLAANTAVRGLDSLGDLDGTTILIEGAAGSVGSAAAAVALSRGATVIGTAGARNLDYLSSIGVIAVEYGAGLSDRVAVVAPDGVDVALDAAGAGTLPELVRITGDASRVTTVADAGRAGPLGVRAVNAQNDSATLEVAAALGATGHYLPRVARAFPIDQVADAHRLSEAGKTDGKVVVTL